MADLYDRASEREDHDRQLAIAAVQMRKPRELPRTGHCHNCNEPLTTGGLFCDADCSADHELRSRAARY
ncbi:hypothetical protein [Pseudomonas phage PPpW-3]|uniref:DUF2116 family Zn-ribbon domain-containing protein n=1 Tax=Pseudomonas phage PPpW-3 TaxID=1279082 RepID=V5YTJ0_9CAUD|nr:DksA-like zinc-finger protein [Pseudomonas phage PPpW-3]BAO20628.1 hypothetical protein [Pseudomonas phage PPpW-3]